MFGLPAIMSRGVVGEKSGGGGGNRIRNNKSNKSKALTYLLWLVGGVCGLHHFYLGRDLQGVLWWCTFGGYFGFGWLRDLFYIGEYVADANNDEKYLKKVDYMVRVHEKVSAGIRVIIRLYVCLKSYYYCCYIIMYAQLLVLILSIS